MVVHNCQVALPHCRLIMDAIFSHPISNHFIESLSSHSSLSWQWPQCCSASYISSDTTRKSNAISSDTLSTSAIWKYSPSQFGLSNPPPLKITVLRSPWPPSPTCWKLSISIAFDVEEELEGGNGEYAVRLGLSVFNVS